MNTFGSTLGAAVLGAALSLPAFHSAMSATCNAGDLDGKWNHHVALYGPFASPSMFWCNVTLTKGTGPDARKYSVSGTCRAQSLQSAALDLNIGGSLSLTETATCKLQGSYFVGQTSPIMVEILNARVEGGPSKNRIVGISRLEGIPNTFTLMRFRFQR